MMKHLVIEVSDNTRSETTKGGTELTKQEAAFDDGGKFPSRFWLTVKQPYKAGRYYLAATSFRVSRFGGLELNPYEINLVPAQ